MILDKIIDQIVLKDGVYDADGQPIHTIGSIVLGAVVRSALVMVVSFFLWEYRYDKLLWLFVLIVLWGYVAYPSYRQYVLYYSHIADIQESTLCGSCKHFNTTNHMCSLYDEHINNDYIPCEGVDWEPR